MHFLHFNNRSRTRGDVLTWPLGAPPLSFNLVSRVLFVTHLTGIDVWTIPSSSTSNAQMIDTLRYQHVHVVGSSQSFASWLSTTQLSHSILVASSKSLAKTTKTFDDE